MGLSLNQAAKQGNVAKTTLHNALKSGEITGSKDDKGRWHIEPSELGRWISSRPSNPDQNASKIQNGTHEKTPENNPLEREVAVLRERLTDKDDTIRDLRGRLDRERDEREKLREERQRLTAMLTDQRHKEPEKPPEAPKSFWARFTRKI